MRSNSNPMSSKKKRSEDSGLTKPGLLYAVRFCSLVAVGLSGYLAWVSFSGGAAVGCGPESNCDKVLHSRWAYWFGLPVSVLAVLMHLSIIGVSMRLGRAASAALQRRAWEFLVPGALVVMGASLWFVGLQVFEVRSICPYCMVAHGSGFLAAMLLLIAAPFRNVSAKPWELEQQVFVSARTFRKLALIAVLALGGLIAGQTLYQRQTMVVTSIPAGTNISRPATASVSSSIPAASIVASDPVAVPLAAAPAGLQAKAVRSWPVYDGRFVLDVYDVPVMGAPTNQNVVVSLFDYTCHHCRAMHPVLAGAQQMFKSSLVIVSLPMPLDPGCNQTMTRHIPAHTNACEYAKLGLTVWRADRTKHPEFDDYLMTGISAPPILEAREQAARLVGAAAFERAAQDPWVEQQLKQDISLYEAAYRAGQGRMPQLIVGTNVAVGTFQPQELQQLLMNNLGLKPAP